MKSVPLHQIVRQIDQAFGDQLPFASQPLNAVQLEVLQGLFGDDGFQSWLQDEVNRQVIRDYLANAISGGLLSEARFAEYCTLVASSEGRELLSLHMLVHSIADAEYLTAEAADSELCELQPDPTSPVQLELVSSVDSTKN